jgi:hypothetical protein
MSQYVPVFEPEEQSQPKRRGVTRVTEYGRAVTFGLSEDRTEFFMKKAMQAQKEARLAKDQFQAPSSPSA